MAGACAPGRLAKGDDAYFLLFVGGLSEIKLTALLKIRPSIFRACRTFDGERQAVSLAGGLGKGARICGSVCLWHERAEENHNAGNCSCDRNLDERFEIVVDPDVSCAHGQVTYGWFEGSNSRQVKQATSHLKISI